MVEDVERTVAMSAGDVSSGASHSVAATAAAVASTAHAADSSASSLAGPEAASAPTMPVHNTLCAHAHQSHAVLLYVGHYFAVESCSS